MLKNAIRHITAAFLPAAALFLVIAAPGMLSAAGQPAYGGAPRDLQAVPAHGPLAGKAPL